MTHAAAACSSGDKPTCPPSVPLWRAGGSLGFPVCTMSQWDKPTSFPLWTEPPPWRSNTVGRRQWVVAGKPPCREPVGGGRRAQPSTSPPEVQRPYGLWARTRG